MSPPDLARGAGGAYRFLVPVRDIRKDEKVVAAALVRAQQYHGAPPDGYNRISRDINDGRGGDYLHLAYKVVVNYSPKVSF